MDAFHEDSRTKSKRTVNGEKTSPQTQRSDHANETRNASPESSRKKERKIKAGHQVYQVKKGQFSELHSAHNDLEERKHTRRKEYGHEKQRKKIGKSGKEEVKTAESRRQESNLHQKSSFKNPHKPFESTGEDSLSLEEMKSSLQGVNVSLSRDTAQPRSMSGIGRGEKRKIRQVRGRQRNEEQRSGRLQQEEKTYKASDDPAENRKLDCHKEGNPEQHVNSCEAKAHLRDIKETLNTKKTTDVVVPDSVCETPVTTNLRENKRPGIIVIPPGKLASEMKESAKDKEQCVTTLLPPNNIEKDVSSELQPMPLYATANALVPNIDCDAVLNVVQSKAETLESLVARGLKQPDGFLDRALKLSYEIFYGYSQIIIHNSTYAFKHDTENYLWKTAYYILINFFRNNLEKQGSDQMGAKHLKAYFWKFLHDAVASFNSILNALQQKYQFDLQYFVSCPLQQVAPTKQVKLALRSCHLLLIYLGDLERYITDVRVDHDYSKAHWYYQYALHLAPKNGKCYNQLGVIAVLCKHKLDAVYYYIRSLESKNPIQTARDRLTGIFQEISRKVLQLKSTERSDDKVKQETSWSDIARLPKPKAVTSDIKEQTDHLRDEIWVFYRSGRSFKVMLSADGVIVDLTPNICATKDPEKRHTKLQLKEVNKRFLLHFLFVHAKLYSRIEFETFTAAHEATVQELKTLLNYPRASSLKQTHLVKYVAINIFSILNLRSKQDDLLDVVLGSPLDSSLVFSLDFFATICEKCQLLLEAEVSENTLLVLNQYLPAVRVWLKWMSHDCEIIGKSSARLMYDIWERLASFTNAVRTVYENFNDWERVEGLIIYPEDALLEGFNPLLSCKQPGTEKAIRHEEQIFVLHVQRLESISQLCQSIASSGLIPLEFDSERETFVVDQQTNTSFSPAKNAEILEIDESSINDQEIDRDVIIEEETEDSEGFSPQFSELKARKLALRDELAEHKQREVEREALMLVHSSKGRVVSENHPYYIIPDTNCFIDHLAELQEIVDSREFIVVVPIIVVSELDGLTSNTQNQLLQTKARQAVAFLEDRFGEKDSCLRAITSKGSELNTIAFRNEDHSKDKGNNDDLILTCCLNYCDETMNRTGCIGEPMVIQRKVVLLTDDRALRVKAHNRYVPTVTVPVFVQLAKLT